MNNIYLGVFGTFGTPNGFTQTFYNQKKGKVGLPLKAFDLKTSAIQLFPRTEIFLLRKERVNNGVPVISYAYYSYAQERGSTRGGTFVGTSISVVNQLLDESKTLTFLKNFQKEITHNYNNFQNGNIMVKHSDEYTINNFQNFENIDFIKSNCNDISTKSMGKTLLIYSSNFPNKLSDYLKKSVELFSLFDTIYFTRHQEVLDYVGRKGLITAIHEEEHFKRLLAQATESRKKECNRIVKSAKEWHKKTTDNIESSKQNFKQKKQQHIDNEKVISKSKETIKDIENFSNDIIKQIEKLISTLKSTPPPSYNKIKEIREKIEEKQSQINQKISGQETPFINSIHTIKTTAVSIERDMPPRKTFSGSKWNSEEREETNSNSFNLKEKMMIGFFVVLISFFSIIGIISSVKWLFFKEEKQVVENYDYQDKEAEKINENNITLTPSTNDLLNKNDIKITIKKLKDSMKIDDVVNVIYNENLRDINQHYEKQKYKYSKLLYQKNESNFEIIDTDTILIDKNLIEIPSYKDDFENTD